MAETTVLNIDFGDTLKRLQEIRNEITTLAQQNEHLRKEMEQATQSAGAYSAALKGPQEQLKANKSAISELSKEYGRIAKVTDDSIKLQKKQQDAFAANRGESKKSLDSQLKDAATHFAQRETIAQQFYENQMTAAEEDLAQRELAQHAFNEKMKDLEAEKQQQTLDILSQTGESILLAEEALHQTRLLNQQQYNEAVAQNNEQAQQQAHEQELKALEEHQRIQQAKLEFAQNVQTSLTAIMQLFGNQGAAAAKFQKALTLFQIGIDTAKSISTTIANATQAASAAGPGAPFVLAGYISSGIATVLGALVQAKKALGDAREPKAPRLAQGGEVPIDVGGKPHSAGGTLFVGDDGNMFEVERGEKIFVLRKTASDFINRYSTINQLFGGNSWTGKPVGHAALGGNITTPFDGGLTARYSRNNVEQQLNLAEVLRNLPAPVVRVTEINRVQRSAERSVGVSEL